MKLFKLSLDCMFWPTVPSSTGKRQQKLPSGTVVFIREKERAAGQKRPFIVEVLDGPYGGYQRYVRPDEVTQFSALEQLAEEAE